MTTSDSSPTLLAVPNLSEGTDPRLVEACAARARAAGARQLDLSSDLDHNRSVLTLAGTPETLVRGTVELAAAAVEYLELRTHRGVHPRLGVLDVLPFVYLDPEARTEAVSAAHRSGESIARRCALPVFFYDDASDLAGDCRRTLPDLRRVGLESLTEDLSTGALEPDCGPTTPHPSAGVVCVGARPPLIAFNLWLDGALSTARSIAASIRESADGGLPGVRALGLRLASFNLSQVSVNVIDHTATSLPELVERVRGEAAARGARVTRSELIGLTPRAALAGAGAEELMLPALDKRQIIESHL